MLQKFLAFMSFFLLLLCFGCQRIEKVITPKEAGTLKIGFMVAGERVTYPNGAEIAVMEINAGGGLLGRRLELIPHINSDAGPEVSVSIAEKLIVEDGVIALLGPNRSTHAVAVGPLAQRYQIPMITTTATNPNVTAAGNFVFMASFTDSFQGAVMAAFAISDLGSRKAATITRRDDLYTEGLGEFFAMSFSELGGEVVASEFYESDALDFTTQLKTIAAAKPDVLFTASFSQEIARITQLARAIGVVNAGGEPIIFLGSDAWDNELLYNDPEAEIEGSYFSGHFSPDTDQAEARAFVATYASIYGATPTGGVAVSYDAVKLLAEAVKRAGSVDPDEIRQQLAATHNYIGATNVGGYDENRHPTKSAVIFTVKEGKKQFHQQIDPF